MNDERTRREFLTNSASLVGLALGSVQSASGETLGSKKLDTGLKEPFAYGKRSGFETSVRTTAGDPNTLPGYVNQRWTPLQDSMGIITPSSLHYMTPHGYAPPDIDPRKHRLMIHGLVDRPMIFTLEELKRLPSVSRIHFIECAGNSDPVRARWLSQSTNERTVIQGIHGRTSCSEWTGVLLSLLLKEAGVQRAASWLVAEGADPGKLTKSIPLEKAMNDVLVAYGQNGEAVRPEQGYPLRLVVPGWEGIHNVKFLRRIKVGDEPFFVKNETAYYSRLSPDGKSHWFEVEMGVKSLITFPSDAHRLPSRGFYEITGLAWSGGGAIRMVEVSTDGGQTWRGAQLQDPVLPKAHTRFRIGWNWDGEETVLQSRCTDERGHIQPSLVELARIWGVTMDYWRSVVNHLVHFNAIQPWKVTRDGSIHDAMFI